MQEIIYLILRQIRRPALILLAAYAVAMLGMVLIPSLDENNELSYLTFFQAFYWVSYTATTIGYGEVPHAFSEWQRFWVAVSIYYTVPAWFYAIGKIISLLQDANFQYALAVSRFQRSVAGLTEKFCIICGFGEAGLRLTQALQAEGFRCVVIEKDPVRLRKLALNSDLSHVLAIEADADNVEFLEKAGIRSPLCRGVVAITDNEAVNLKVALAARLLSSEHRYFKIVCRTYSRSGSNQAKALTVDIIINTNRIFTEQLLTALRRPAIAELLARFNGVGGERFEMPPVPPFGRWLICGNNALGLALKRFLDYEGIDCLTLDPTLPNGPDSICGLGNEAVTLRAARIDRAQAIVTARNSDAENLSIALTAKSMHPAIFVVGKQNKSLHKSLFAVAGFDRLMEEADLIVSQTFSQLARPLLSRFLKLLSHQDEQWGQQLLKRINQWSPDRNPYHRMVRIDAANAPAVVEQLASGRLLRLQTLWAPANQPESVNEALPLLLVRKDQDILLPEPATSLQLGDKILLAYAQRKIEKRLRINLFDEAQLYYSIHGKEKVKSPVFAYLLKKWE